MGRRNISQLRSPTKGRDVTKLVEPMLSGFKFETKQESKAEDKKRRKILKRDAHRPKTARAGLSKRDLLNVARNIKDAQTAASNRYMRKHRQRIINAIHDLSKGQADQLIFVTLIPFGFNFSGGSLHKADANKLLERLRQVMLRYGSGEGRGWLIGFLDGEFEPDSKTFVLHFHGLATADYANVFSRIRRKGRLFAGRGASKNDKVRTRIRMNQDLTNLPRVAGYIIKGFWPERLRGKGSDGNKITERQKRRIKGPYHSEYLVWLDRYRIQDLCLMVGLKVDGDGCLKPTT